MMDTFVLGTVQLGLAYGAANRHGLPTDEEAEEILSLAVDQGVRLFDTARAYGRSEERIGRFLRTLGVGTERIDVITKLDPLNDLNPTVSSSEVTARVKESVEASRSALGVPALQTLLLHRWEHRRSYGGAIWATLAEMRERGAIGVLGASVSTPLEALDCLADPDIGHLQVPVNCVDWRWDEAGVPDACARRPDVVVHARSVLLQGLLAADQDVWPEIGGVDPTTYLEALDGLARRWEFADRRQLSIAFVRGLEWVDGIVIGAETPRQLAENVAAFELPPLSPEQRLQLRASLPRAPEMLLNPALWPQRTSR
jgi:aryl-alcohol dehydrogenase-like predicted oxidoreductase